MGNATPSTQSGVISNLHIATDGAKTIFNTCEIDFREVIKSLSREALEQIAFDQCMKLSILSDNVYEMRSVNPSPSRDKLFEIAGDMLLVVEDNDFYHDALYGGVPREALLSLFPALRAKGEAA